MKKGRILIVDDNEDILFALSLLLSPLMEKVNVTTNPERMLHFMEEYKPDVILLDMNFNRDAVSGQEGFHWLEQLMKHDPDAVIILMTAYADTEKAVRAIKQGATDYISKPWEKEKLLATLGTAIDLRHSRAEATRLNHRVVALAEQVGDGGRIIGESPVMLELFESLDMLSQTNANVLIMGENGTGKDLVAKHIHRNSSRRDKVFITIDLGGIPEQLFESELFGYEKGAFTDARKNKPGRMEIAENGTLLLDEIGNLNLPLQTKLLTAIEKKQINRLGATENIPIDVRFIAATNSDLYDMAERGVFRQDLLYRINTIELQVPPLRERGEDIILLADFFLSRLSQRYNKNILSIDREAKRKLLRYHWPGNVRELEHVIERAVILSKQKQLTSDDLVLNTGPASKRCKSEDLNLQNLEVQAIKSALKVAGGNMTFAAEMLGISRFSLYRKMEKLNL